MIHRVEDAPEAAQGLRDAAPAVGRVHRTFVDRSRPTPASGGRPKGPDRTIETTVLYPATGQAGDAVDSVVDDAAPAGTGRPFPFVVLAHGLGGSEEHLTPFVELSAGAALPEVLATMRREGTHLGRVVVDGRTTGLVALEDVLEQLIGDVRDAAVDRSRGGDLVDSAPQGAAATGAGAGGR